MLLLHPVMLTAALCYCPPGIKGTYQGLTATVLKQGSNQAIRFYVMTSLRNWYKGTGVSAIIIRIPGAICIKCLIVGVLIGDQLSL